MTKKGSGKSRLAWNRNTSAFCLGLLAVFLALWMITLLPIGSIQEIMHMGAGKSLDACNSQEHGHTVGKRQGYTSHAPIYIDGNAGFTPANGVVSGSGTQSDPYIIEAWEINGSGGYSCIEIRNTDAWFVIRNCYVHYSGTTSYDAAIKAYNITNGRLEGNIASNNYNGIFIYGSSSNTIANNTVNSNSGNGIYLSSSNSNRIVNNTANSNGIGIFLLDSSSNTVANNTMVNDGIYIDGSELEYWNTHEIATSNTINGKPVYYWKNQTGGMVPPGAGQVILANCTGVIVQGQNVGDGTCGIELGFSNNNTITNNTAYSNYYSGIILYQSNNNRIANNTAYLNNNGIALSDSNNNTIANNTAYLNNNNGIALSYSNSNTIANNTAYSNNNDGIALYISSISTIINNTVYLNNNGIALSYSNNNTIANNTAYSNNKGIIFSYSGSNTIANNTVYSNNNNGFTFYNAHSNIVANNAAYSNNNGIYLSYSNGNTIANNTAYLNNDNGIALPYTSSNTVTNNTAYLNNNNGIYLYISSINTIAKNIAYLNSNSGIYLNSSSSNMLTKNIFWNNTLYGVYLAYGSASNTIYHNNFLLNGNGAYSQAYDMGSNFWNTSTEGNYWSDWTLPDTDCNGIVDSPYNIDGGTGAKDYYPLVNPTVIYIFSVTHDAIGTLTSGSMLNVTLIGTPNGIAWFSLGTIAENITLYDDGLHNDGSAGDGIYVGSYVVQSGDDGIWTITGFLSNGIYNVSKTDGAIVIDTNLHTNPPVITSTNPPDTSFTMQVSTTQTFSVVASDPDSDPITYAWTVDGSPVGTNSASYTYTAPATAGTHTIEVTVSDGSHTVTHLWSVTVETGPVNHAPVFETYSPAYTVFPLQVSTPWDFYANATDVDGDTITYSWSLDGMPVGTNSNHYQYPGSSNAGETHILTVTASDGTLVDVMTWTIKIQTTVSQAPVLVASSPAGSSISIPALTAQTFSVTANDPDGDTLTYTWYVDDIVVSGQTGTSYTSQWSSPGVHTVSVDISDGSWNLTREWTVTVTAPNAAPVITASSPSDPVSIEAGSSQTFSITVTDAEGDTITYTWTVDGSPVGTNSNTYSYTAPSTAGTHVVKVVVSDGSHNVEKTWSVTVTVTPSNHAPAINGTIPVITLEEDSKTTLDLKPYFIDIENDPLTFTLTWAHGTITVSNGVATFQPNANWEGTDTITINCSDGKGGFVEATILITVTGVNDAPTGTITITPVKTKYKDTDKITFTVTASDPDDTTLSYEWKDGTKPISGVSNVSTFTKKFSAGTHTVSVTISDGKTTTTVTANAIKVEKSQQSSPGFEMVAAFLAIALLVGTLVVLRRRF